MLRTNCLKNNVSNCVFCFNRKFTAGSGIDRYLDKAFEAMSEKLEKDPNLVSEEMGYLVAFNILLSMCFGKAYVSVMEYYVITKLTYTP